MKEQEEKKLQEAIEKHLLEDIAWEAHKNPIIQVNKGDVEQFASDSFCHGWQAAKGSHSNEIEDLKNKPKYIRCKCS